MMNAMLVSFGLSSNMWGEAILLACYIQNKVPHKKTGKTPYELWERRKPLTWNTLKCGGVWLRLCCLSLKRENLVLKHVIVYLLDMLAIVHVIDF